MGTHASSEQGVAIRSSPGDPGAAKRSARTSDILDNHRLTECLGHVLEHDARHHITWATCRERHNDRYWTRWIVLTVSGKRQQQNAEYR
jgi:hypothetical protein